MSEASFITEIDFLGRSALRSFLHEISFPTQSVTSSFAAQHEPYFALSLSSILKPVRANCGQWLLFASELRK
jgi:hypothetical protein